MSFFRHNECKQLFETISGDQFTTKDLGEIYDLIKSGKLNYTEDQIEKINQIFSTYGIYSVDFNWPIVPEKLREALIREWKLARGEEIINRAYKSLKSGGSCKAILSEIEKVEAEHIKRQSSLKDHLDAIAKEYLEGKTKGFPTGIPDVDKATDQLQKGHFWVIAASTNSGKTTLTLQIVRNALSFGAKVDFITLEMSAEQLLKRMSWLEASMKKIKFPNAIENLIDLPLVVTENLRKIDEIRAHIESSDADLIVIDYVQLIRGGKDYYDEATQASNMLQEMAIKKMIPIIGLSQVTKESYKAGKSFSMDFKGSGAIAESADVAIELYRERENQVEIADVDLLIKKNRHGPIGETKISFDTKRGYFIY